MSTLRFLGLAKRAGKVEAGDEGVTIAARAGKAKLILTAADAGRSTCVRADNSAQYAKCPVASLPYTKDELGAALGRDTVGVAAVTDIGFAHALIEKLHAEKGGFDELLAALAVQNDRAEARRKEQRRHEQKKRRGIK